MAICVIAVVGVAPCQCLTPGGNQIYIAGMNFLDRTGLTLRQARAGRDDQRLT